ncbi:MAG: hypothetical protein ACO2O2_01425, partial [Acidilobaceae archaeon]
MNSSTEELVKQIVLAKSRALLHDPPNKIWVLKEHEDVARKFRDNVVTKTPLNEGLKDDFERIVGRADVTASAFDRWLINMLYVMDSSKTPVWYERLHSILRPDKHFELHAVSEDKALEVAGE